jgi:hypothetical protein
VTINRVYKLVLLLSITLQLSLFFMGVTVSLFLDQLFNGWAGHLAWNATLYKIGFIITGVVRNHSSFPQPRLIYFQILIPWLMLVRRRVYLRYFCASIYI